MNHTRLDVTTADGTMDVYLHAPPGTGRLPTVILFPDAFGVRPSMHSTAAELAEGGYLVVLVNQFHRSGEFAPFDPKTAFSNPSERERIMGIMKKADAPSVMRDVGALLEALGKQARAKTDRVAFFGYCMGGRLAFVAACTFGERVAAAASFHPGGLATDAPDSPHLHVSGVRARLYLGIADNDQSMNEASQAKLKEALDAAKVRYELEVYPGALHGFAVTDSHVYDAAARSKHWTKLRALLSEALPRA